MKKNNRIVVKIGHFGIARGQKVLITRGLGSCVGLVLYDEKVKVGGLVHLLLPENPGSGRPTKYVDTGIELLIEKMEEKGANKERMIAKLAGGATMFEDIVDSNNSIGERNLKKTREILANYRIPVVAEDIGKNYGRSIKFFVGDGKLLVSSYNRSEKEL